MKKVLISTSSFGKFSEEPIEILKKACLDITFNPHGRVLTKDEIINYGSQIHGLIAGTEELGKEVLGNLKNLKVISRCGGGLDNIDLETAKSMGIKIFSSPDAPAIAVAELTIGLILACLRHIPANDRNVRQGKWNKPMGELLAGKTIGIIGYGRIGKSVSRLLLAFGAKVLVYDVIKPLDAGRVSVVTFDDLIANSDIITLHIPKNKGQGYLINDDVISRMKQCVCIINTSRGGLIDEEALYRAAKSGRIAGCAVDVFENEPYKGKLTELDNVILSPHVGSYAREARIDMEKQAADNLLLGFREQGVI